MLLQELFTVGIGFGSDNEGMCWIRPGRLSTSFMSLSPSSTGNLIFGLIISGAVTVCVQGEFGNPEVVFLSFEDYCQGEFV